MIDRQLQAEAGAAVLWKGVQLVGTKLIYFVRLFVLARLLSPADFGLMAVAMVAVDVLVSVTNLGLVPALIQRHDVRDSHYRAAWTVGLLRALTITLLVFLGAPVIARLVGEPRVLDLVRVLALLPTIDALASMGLAELMRRLAFRQLAIADLARSVLNTVIAISLASSLGVWALVAGSLAGAAAYTAISYVLAPFRPGLTLDWAAVRPLIRFGRWIFFTSLVAVAGSAVLRVVVSRQLGATELGLYYLATRLAFLPTEVASDVIGAVTFPMYARLQHRLDQAAHLFRATLVGLAALLVPTFTLIVILAPGLVTHVLGPRWQGTALIIQLLAVVGVLGLITDLAVPAFKGLGHPTRFTLVEGAQSLLLVVFITWLTGRFGLLGAPLAWFPAGLGSLAVAVLYLRRILPRPFAGQGGLLAAITLASVLAGVVAASVYAARPTFGGLILTGVAGGGLSAILLWLLDRRTGQTITASLALFFPPILALLRPAPAVHPERPDLPDRRDREPRLDYPVRPDRRDRPEELTPW